MQVNVSRAALSFATRFRGELTTEDPALRSYYQKRLDERGGADYCGDTNLLFDNVMSIPIGHLAAYSHEHPARTSPAMETCGGVPTKKA
jgi:hypothetical protein